MPFITVSVRRNPGNRSEVLVTSHAVWISRLGRVERTLCGTRLNAPQGRPEDVLRAAFEAALADLSSRSEDV